MKQRTQLMINKIKQIVGKIQPRTTVGVIVLIIIVIGPATSATAGKDLALTQTPLPDPLSTPLPTPRALPITARRPPLYPIPWALGLNDHFYFSRPIAPDEVNWPLSYYKFGATNFAPTIPHTGVDIEVGTGTPVIAAADGLVVWADYGLMSGGINENDPYGIAVSIEHDFGYNNEPLYTTYAHLSRTVVKKGDYVKRGDIVAFSGGTGNVTAPHLHFEVRLGENKFYNSVNPELWTVPPVGWGVLAGRIMNSWGIPVENLQIRITSYATGQRWYPSSYGTLESIKTDPYYRENLVLSDLPAGTYEIFVPYVGGEFRKSIQIRPGTINYFNFQGFEGINFNRPLVVIPQALKPTPTPTQEP